MSDETLCFSAVDAVPRSRHRWLVFAVMVTAEAMDVLDSTVINVAGPSLEHELHASPVELQWAIGGYTLAMGAGLIIGGRLGDIYGRRRMFLIAMAAFALASLLCAIAPAMGTLIVARFLQGMAGALLLPQGFALLRDVFTQDELPKALAIFGPVMGASAMAGPVIGGGIIQADIMGLGWRATLGVNVPIAVAALIIAWRVLPRRQGMAEPKSIDLIGALLMAVPSGLLVLALVEGQASGWGLWTWLCLCVAAVGMIIFVLQQRFRTRHGAVVLVEPSLFAKSAFTAGIAGMALFFSAFIGTQLVFTLFLQLGKGFSAGQAGLAAIPFAAAAFLGSGVAGAVLLKRLGRGVVQLGALLQIASVVWLVADLSSPQFSFWHIVPALMLMGAGEGLVMASLINIAISAAEDQEVGSGAGLLAAVQAISSAAGIAAFGGLFFAYLAKGDPASGYQRALEFQALMLTIFIAVSFRLPAKARAESMP